MHFQWIRHGHGQGRMECCSVTCVVTITAGHMVRHHLPLRAGLLLYDILAPNQVTDFSVSAFTADGLPVGISNDA